MIRILFVDDEENILGGIRRMLHAYRDRWETEFVTNGQDALLAAEEQAFDVVVSDLRMPDMDGAELLGHIRDQFPGAARIVLSGYSEPGLAARAAKVAHLILAKPCNPEEFKDSIENLCYLQDIIPSPSLGRVTGSTSEPKELEARNVLEQFAWLRERAFLRK